MEALLFIAFREGMEAFLILGIVLAFLDKSALQALKSYAWAGVGVGALLSFAAAFVFSVFIDGFESESVRYLVNLAILLLAILFLSFMLFWIDHHAHAGAMQQKIADAWNRKAVVFFLMMLAVLREGMELVLFWFALTFDGMITLQEGIVPMFAGLGVSAGMIWMIGRVAVRISLGRFFRYSSYLILLIAAGLTALFVKGVQQAGYLGGVSEPLFDLSGIIANDSYPGRLLGALIGYDATPTALQFAGWMVYIVAIPGIKIYRQRRRYA